MFKIVLKLEKAMGKEQYFMDGELTLDKLSKLTGINKYHIIETLYHLWIKAEETKYIFNDL